MNKKGFTLLELLVVVLIIGILAGIALPQYNKAVEKARLTEALINARTIEDAIKRYIWANGYPNSSTDLVDLPIDVELSGGEWDEYGSYQTEYFDLTGWVNSNAYTIEIDRKNNGSYIYALEIDSSKEDPKHCVTQFTDMGTYICHYLESQGWKYWDNEF